MATSRSSMSAMMGGKGKQKPAPKPVKKSMGFAAAQQNIAAKEGVPMKAAGAILAASTRKASPAAKKANPNLKKVK